MKLLVCAWVVFCAVLLSGCGSGGDRPKAPMEKPATAGEAREVPPTGAKAGDKPTAQPLPAGATGIE